MALQPAAPGGRRLTDRTGERTGLLAFLVYEFPLLVAELHLLRNTNGARDLLAAAEEARKRPCSLTISADMSPELGEEPEVPRRGAQPLPDRKPPHRPWWRYW